MDHHLATCQSINIIHFTKCQLINLFAKPTENGPSPCHLSINQPYLLCYLSMNQPFTPFNLSVYQPSYHNRLKWTITLPPVNQSTLLRKRLILSHRFATCQSVNLFHLATSQSINPFA
jgi:hypothetical protein